MSLKKLESSTKFFKKRFSLENNNFFEFPHSDRVLNQIAIGTNSTNQESLKVTEKKEKIVHLQHLEKLKTFYRFSFETQRNVTRPKYTKNLVLFESKDV